MNDDGHIDFSAFSLDELNEALGTINRSKYPKNFERLMIELSSREQLPAKEARVSNDETLWGRIWGADLAESELKSARATELSLFVGLLVIGVLVQEYFFDPLLASLDIPAGRWLRFFYFTLAGTVVGGLFYFRKKRNLFSQEVFVIAVGSVVASWALNFLVVVVLAINSNQFGCGVGCTSILLISSLCLDLMLMYLAWRFPIRWIMRLLTQ